MENNASADEKLLLEQVAAGNEKAFAILIGRYWNNIYAQALTYVSSTHHAQDIVQDVFLRIWEKRTQLQHIDRFDAFLFIVARNLIISELRKKIAAPLPKEWPEEARELTALPDQQLALKQLQNNLANAIAQLPPQQKTAYLLSRDEGLSFEKIAQRMGISRETVKKHIGKALNSIRTFISLHADTLPFLTVAWVTLPVYPHFF
jgi:RNA polymerase sigma-70 factor (ECF subfamily)